MKVSFFTFTTGINNTNPNCNKKEFYKFNTPGLPHNTICFGKNFNYKMSLNNAEAIKKIADIKQELKDAIAENNVKEILEYFGIKCKTDENNFLIISHYKPLGEAFQIRNIQDIGIDENKLFEKIVKIEGNASFHSSKLQDLGNLTEIGGDADFADSLITNLGNLEKIGKNAWFQNSHITNLGNLKSIGGHANFMLLELDSLGKLEKIGEDAHFYGARIKNLGKLKFIGENACFVNSTITNLDNIETIGGDADFYRSNVTNLGNLKSVGGKIFINKSLLRKEHFSNIKNNGIVET